MNREEARKKGGLLLAYADGKQIQYKSISTGKWEDLTNPSFDDGNITRYRVKPESKLVPFTFEDRKLFMGKTVVHEHNEDCGIIIYCDNKGVSVGDQIHPYYPELLSDWIFEDGSPCGKLVEE